MGILSICCRLEKGGCGFVEGRRCIDWDALEKKFVLFNKTIIFHIIGYWASSIYGQSDIFL